MMCLTPSEQVLVLDMADDIVTYKKRIVAKDTVIATQKQTISELQKNYAESKRETALQKTKTDYAISDKAVVEKDLLKSQKQTARQKVGLWCLGVVAIIETIFIGGDRLLLH